MVYGPTTLTGHYHFTGLGPFTPYVGGGVVGLLVFRNEDKAFTNLSLKPGLGLAVQAGVDYQLDPHWSVFADVKKAYLRTTATGNFAGAAVKSKVTLDPLVLSTGVGYRF